VSRAVSAIIRVRIALSAQSVVSFLNHFYNFLFFAGISSLKDLGLLRINTIAIQTYAKPKKVRTAMHVVRKLCSLFKSGLKDVG
jgi:hypothetical protein